VILRFVVSVEHQLLTDGQAQSHTHTHNDGYTPLAWRRAVKTTGVQAYSEDE